MYNLSLRSGVLALLASGIVGIGMVVLPKNSVRVAL
jgi:hypothetical protein